MVRHLPRINIILLLFFHYVGLPARLVLIYLSPKMARVSPILPFLCVMVQETTSSRRHFRIHRLTLSPSLVRVPVITVITPGKEGFPSF